MSAAPLIEKLPTGVPGLDVLLHGGIPRYSVNLISGGPGCGKTTLAHQIMFSMARPDRRAMFFTASGEPALKVLRYQSQYAFFDAGKIGPMIRYVNIADDLQKWSLEGALERIMREIADYRPELIFLESVRQVLYPKGRDHAGASRELQYFVQQLGLMLSTWQATSFLIFEFVDARREDDPIFTVADGVIHLCQENDQSATGLRIRVQKLRGSAHVRGLNVFRISNAGLRIFPRVLRPFAEASDPALPPTTAVRLSTGNRDLDAMLGGGIPAGYSVMVAGPPGCGKTVLATAFLADGAQRGERGVMASIEQGLSAMANRPLLSLMDGGMVSVVPIDELDITIEEVAARLLEEVARTGATRLVIDSLSALEFLLIPQARHQFLEYLFRLVAHLSGRGITVLLLRSTRGIDHYDFDSGYFVVDGIISMRYVEMEQRLMKVIAVPKLRGSARSEDVRGYALREDGIDLRGVGSGVLSWT